MSDFPAVVKVSDENDHIPPVIKVNEEIYKIK